MYMCYIYASATLVTIAYSVSVYRDSHRNNNNNYHYYYSIVARTYALATYPPDTCTKMARA